MYLLPTFPALSLTVSLSPGFIAPKKENEVDGTQVECARSQNKNLRHLLHYCQNTVQVGRDKADGMIAGCHQKAAKIANQLSSKPEELYFILFWKNNVLAWLHADNFERS